MKIQGSLFYLFTADIQTPTSALLFCSFAKDGRKKKTASAGVLNEST
jgi:hypothetical protein